MEYQQVSSVPAAAAAAFSKKPSNGRGGFSGKHEYDGVFAPGGGAAKLGARVEDYREIFGGSAAAGSSIPILDVPELNEDSNLSKFSLSAQRIDYSKIFGGSGDADFGLPREELFAKPKKVKSSVKETQTRSPAEAKLRNAGSEHSNLSREQKASSPEATFQSYDGVKHFSVSYNKSNPGSKNGTNGMTHIAQLHSVPGYTVLVDEITPSKKAEDGKPVQSILNDAHLNVNASASVKEDKARRKVVSGPQPSLTTADSFRRPAELQKKSSRTRSMSNDLQFDAFGIGLEGYPPSSSSPNFSNKKGDTFLVDEITPSKKEEGGKPVRSVLNGAHLNVNASENVTEDKACRKAVSGPQPSFTAADSFRSPAESQKKSSRLRSMSNDMQFDAFGIGLGIYPPSSSPPNFRNSNGDSDRSNNLKFGVSRNDASEGTSGNHSPAFSDEQMDENSDAAASAAALRKAIEEAQMKIKIAKELMTRKKEGLQNHAKANLNDSWKAERSKVKSGEAQRSNKGMDRVMCENESPKQGFAGLSENSTTKGIHLIPEFKHEKSSIVHNAVGETHSIKSKPTRTDDRQEEAKDWESTEEFFDLPKEEGSGLSESNTTKVSQLIPDCKDEKSFIDNNAAGETHSMEFKSTQMDYKQEEAKEWESTEEFFDAPMEEGTGLSENNATKASQLVPDSKAEKSSIDNNAVWETQGMDFKSTQMDYRQEEAKDWESTEEFFDAEGDKEMPSEFEQEDSAKKMVLEACSDDPKAYEEALKEDKVERELNSVIGAFQWNIYANFIKPTQELHCEEENEETTGVGDKLEEDEQVTMVSHEWEECEAKMEKLNHSEENAELPIREDNDSSLGEVYEKEEPVEEHEEGRDSLEFERKHQEARNLEEHVERHKEDWDSLKFERRQPEACNLVENEEKQNDICWEAETEISGEFHEEETVQSGINDLKDKGEGDERLGEDGRTEEHKMLEEPKANEEVLEKSEQMNSTEKRGERTCEWVEAERMGSESRLGTDDENMEATEQASRYEGSYLHLSNDADKRDENENLGGSDNGFGCNSNVSIGNLKAGLLTAEENGRMTEVTEVSPLAKETVKGLKAVEDANSWEKQQSGEISGFAQGIGRLDRIEMQTVDAVETLVICGTDIDSENKEREHHVTECGSVPNQENCTEEVKCELDGSCDPNICKFEVDTNNEESEKSSISSHNERWSGDEAESLHDPESHVEEAACEFGENSKDIEESEVTTNHEEDELESSHEERWEDNDPDAEASEQPCGFEGQGTAMEIFEEEELSQSTDKKDELHQKDLTMEEMEAEDTLPKEVDVEKKQFSKKEDAKERELEKEKERIAVERAFAEARERAERAAMETAAAEAHQRLKAEARERLERVSSEANNKLTAENASMEAKLKAERAAVERATAEARQRALEKALSEKADFRTRNQVERSSSEKFSSVSKENGINSRDHQPSRISRFPGSSNHDERYNGGNGESALRDKATIERNQRTAERAAKALAEKNKRDLLAQKEQAERNRLAETLDADVKRWSSGKERNLRALLSTLQYILGTDSGWQPIPLMDLISSTAVKKAYRKATLFVHPDKLQQRGASIQQKYTCEKVFDLLKDAWNKFSAEER